MTPQKSSHLRNWIAILSIAALSISVPAIAGPDDRDGRRKDWSPLTQEQHQQYQQYREETIQARLNLQAKQLNITSAQQGAWNDYSEAVKQTMRFDKAPPARDADAATIAQFRADRSAEHAKALARLSDATAKLQNTLSAEQRSAFNDTLHYRGGGEGRWNHKGHGRGGYGHSGYGRGGYGCGGYGHGRW